MANTHVIIVGEQDDIYWVLVFASTITFRFISNTFIFLHLKPDWLGISTFTSVRFFVLLYIVLIILYSLGNGTDSGVTINILRFIIVCLCVSKFCCDT